MSSFPQCFMLIVTLLAVMTQSRIGLVIPNNFESFRLVCPPQSPFPCAATDGEFTQTNQFDLANHRFYEGYFGCQNADAVITTSGLATINAALTTQLMIDTYRNTDHPIDIILTYGIAGGMDDRLNIGDVVVPSKWAIYNLWNWQDADDGDGVPLQLEMFGDYDREFGYWETPQYHRVWFQPQELYLEPEVRTRTHFFKVDANAMNIMKSIETQLDNDLINCIPENPTECLDHTPRVYTSIENKDVIGLTADIFVDNEAWRTTLFEFYQAQSIDMETGSVAMVAATNEIPFLGFRSVSDLAGGEDPQNAVSIFLALAVQNSITVLTEFIDAAYCQNANTGSGDDDDDDDDDDSNEQVLFSSNKVDSNVMEQTDKHIYKIVIHLDTRIIQALCAIIVGFFLCFLGVYFCRRLQKGN